MPRSLIILVLALGAVLGFATTARAGISYLDNGTVRVGVDLDRGGLIVHLSRSGAASPNLVDASVGNRGIQPWFQRGPAAYGNPRPPYASNPWNPVLGGDVYGHPSIVEAATNDGTTVYTKTTPLQWALNGNSYCGCRIEQWVTLDGPAVLLRERLTSLWGNNREPAPFDQQLPSVHLVPTLNRAFAYDGVQPFANRPLTELATGPQPGSVTSTESWVALTDAAGFGVGVFHAGIMRFAFGSGFVAPTRLESLDRSVYDDTSTLVVGTVGQIRDYVQAHRDAADGRPDYRFTQIDRRHWSLVNMDDTWSDAVGVLDAIPGSDPQLIGPDEWFAAGNVPTLYVRGAWHTSDNLAQLFWSNPRSSFTEGQSVRFRVTADGLFHTYAVPLEGQPLWLGTITQLRFDPVCCAESNSLVQLASISWRPDPQAIPVTIEHPRAVRLRLVRDRRHRLGAVGAVVGQDAYDPCASFVPVQIQNRTASGWITVRTVVSRGGGGFSVALARKSRARYRALVSPQTFGHDLCVGASSSSS